MEVSLGLASDDYRPTECFDLHEIGLVHTDSNPIWDSMWECKVSQLTAEQSYMY